MNEHIIENLTKYEIDLINNSPDADNIEWYPDNPANPVDLDNTDIVIEGTDADVQTMLEIIGRK